MRVACHGLTVSGEKFDASNRDTVDRVTGRFSHFKGSRWSLICVHWLPRWWPDFENVITIPTKTKKAKLHCTVVTGHDGWRRSPGWWADHGLAIAFSSRRPCNSSERSAGQIPDHTGCRYPWLKPPGGQTKIPFAARVTLIPGAYRQIPASRGGRAVAGWRF